MNGFSKNALVHVFILVKESAVVDGLPALVRIHGLVQLLQTILALALEQQQQQQ